MSSEEVAAEEPATPPTRRELAVAQALDQARLRAEHRVRLFLDAALELMYLNSGEFTVQEVVERSGQSLRTFYNYFAGKHELLLALFEESIRSAATHLQAVIVESHEPLERLHRFVVDYYGMCRLDSKRRQAKGPAPAMVEFAQQLLTSHPQEASSAFGPLVSLLEELLADAESAGKIRRGLDRRRIAGVILQATMFNAFATTISGAPPLPDARDAAEMHWDLLLRGIATSASN
jgi:AcrR family transcriptional regulator